MVLGGSSTVFWDLFASQKVGKMRAKMGKRKVNPQRMAEESDAQQSIPMARTTAATEGVQRRWVAKNADSSVDTATSPAPAPENSTESREGNNNQSPNVDTDSHSLPVKWGLVIIAGFFGMSISKSLSIPISITTSHQLPSSLSSLLADYSTPHH